MSTGYINLPSTSGSGIESINGDSTANQSIVGGSGISVSTVTGTTTITNTAAATDSFVIMQTPLGTSPTATSATDTLDWLNTDTYITITGNAGAKSITLGIGTPLLTLINGKVSSVTASSPLASSGGTTPNLTIQQASSSQAGYLSSTDWSTFNNKQPAGNYITALTGDGTASGPGSAAFTLSTVNSNVGTFLYPQITVNAKGLVTAASTPTQTANFGFYGPTSGAAAIPTFRAAVLADLPAASGQSFITSGTTYTTPANINTNTLFKFVLIGGGGGGGGANTAAAGGCGGGSSGSCIIWVTGLSPSTAYTIAIGAAGTAGTNAASSGGAGGNTTLTVGATTYTARGGGGGGVGTVGGAGGTCTNGTINITGQRGDDNDGASTSPGTSGGNSLFGFGGGYAQGGSGAAVTGYAATGYGGGGGGGAFSGGTKAGGGVGTQGCIVVTWSV